MGELGAIWAELSDVTTILGGIAGFAGGVFAAYKWAYRKGVREGQRKVTHERDAEALEHLYGPLVALFLDVHLSSSTFTRYPTLGRRLAHAVEVFRDRKHLKAKLKGFWHAVGDRGDSEPAVEVEYGGGFPTRKIGALLSSHSHLASPELIRLYRITSRDEYEEDLSGSHLELLEHVFDEYERLSRRVRFE